MTFLLPAVLVLLAVLAIACGDDDDDGNGGDDGSPTASAAATLPTPTPAVTQEGDPCGPNLATPASSGELTWEAIAPAEVPAPEGWTVSDAEGDAPLLAVNDGSGVVGTLELLQFEVPFNPNGGYPEFEVWVDDFYQETQTDRVAGIGSGQGGANPGLTIVFEQHTPAPFGEFCGIAYGYTITDQSGAIIERYAGRATFDSTKIYLVVALYDAALGGEMGFVSAESLAAYEPFMTPLAESLSVPAE
jgi:hypothetical protein